jgi:hypothetical protein
LEISHIKKVPLPGVMHQRLDDLTHAVIAQFFDQRFDMSEQAVVPIVCESTHALTAGVATRTAAVIVIEDDAVTAAVLGPVVEYPGDVASADPACGVDEQLTDAALVEVMMNSPSVEQGVQVSMSGA